MESSKMSPYMVSQERCGIIANILATDIVVTTASYPLIISHKQSEVCQLHVGRTGLPKDIDS